MNTPSKQCGVCTVAVVPGEGETRSLVIFCGGFQCAPRGDDTIWSALDDERAYACGQRDALVLYERYLERGTFLPADHNAPQPDQEAFHG